MSGSNASSIPDSQWRLDAHLLSIAHLPPCSSGRAGQHDQLYPAACVIDVRSGAVVHALGAINETSMWKLPNKYSNSQLEWSASGHQLLVIHVSEHQQSASSGSLTILNVCKDALEAMFTFFLGLVSVSA